MGNLKQESVSGSEQSLSCDGDVVQFGVDGIVGTGWRAGRVETTERGSGAGSELRAHAGVGDEPVAKTLGVAGGQEGECRAGDA